MSVRSFEHGVHELEARIKEKVFSAARYAVHSRTARAKAKGSGPGE